VVIEVEEWGEVEVEGQEDQPANIPHLLRTDVQRRSRPEL
jgi:hypothetical protein